MTMTQNHSSNAKNSTGKVSLRCFFLLFLLFLISAGLSYMVREKLFPGFAENRILLLSDGKDGTLSYVADLLPYNLGNIVSGFLSVLPAVAAELLLFWGAGLTAFPYPIISAAALWRGFSFGTVLSFAKANILVDYSFLSICVYLLSTSLLFAFASGSLPGRSPRRVKFVSYTHRFLIVAGTIFCMQLIVFVLS